VEKQQGGETRTRSHKGSRACDLGDFPVYRKNIENLSNDLERLRKEMLGEKKVNHLLKGSVRGSNSSDHSRDAEVGLKTSDLSLQL